MGRKLSGALPLQENRSIGKHSANKRTDGTAAVPLPNRWHNNSAPVGSGKHF
jgi:hypothetical protein